MTFVLDHLVFTPADVDLARSPLAGKIDAETFVLGAFNPGMARLRNGNLLLMVRIAEALRHPKRDGHIHSLRWSDGGYRLDAWPLALVDTADPRAFTMAGGRWKAAALTSLSWLLPVELDPEGRRVEAVHYDCAVAPAASYQCYGIEDARISRVGERWLMTTCSVSPERQCTTLHTSGDARDWRLEGIVLDHQNKDMLIFGGLIDGEYWAQTRPLGNDWFAYPPGSEWRAGPSINLARSPDALHWKPHDQPGIRPHAATTWTARMGGGAPPVLTPDGWLSLWHGVEPSGAVGIYRTYWSLLDPHAPDIVCRTAHQPLIEPAPHLTEPLKDQMYLANVVFTTGLVDGGDVWIVASGEADLACRITHVPKSAIA
ncbi:glycosidase [Sphingomonas sp.]|uniref:glycoside hydrolase family 130 protein n=1 Tax=Sphingomonas sp. TaxID=28214 RepID=UPI003CC61628